MSENMRWYLFYSLCFVGGVTASYFFDLSTLMKAITVGTMVAVAAWLINLMSRRKDDE